MRHSVLILLLIFISQFGFGQDKYQYEIDLNKLENDQLKVKLLTPKIQTDEVVFYLP